MKITTGKISKAQKVVIYGVEGIGKSTLASHFPSPLFIDTEGSTNNMEVARFDKPTSWTMLLEQVAYVKQNAPCDTLVIDTADWADYLCQQHVMSVNHWNSIEEPGYGKGYVAVREEFGKLLNQLSDVVDSGINVVLTAHAEMKKVEKPDELGAYDHYQLKMSTKAAGLVKEWSDLLLFLNYETVIVTDSKNPNSKKATGGKRFMYTTHHPAWDAKNRHELPEKLPLDYASIAPIFEKVTNQAKNAGQVKEAEQQTTAQPKQEELSGFKETMAATVPTNSMNFGRDPVKLDPATPKALADLMSANAVTENELRQTMSDNGIVPFEMAVKDYPPDLIDGMIIPEWAGIFSAIKSKRKF